MNRARRLPFHVPNALARRGLQALRRWMAGMTLCLAAAAPATATPPNVIVGAVYADPVDRYRHDVLGPDAEWGALRLTLETCLDCSNARRETVVIRLPETRVFEDIAPRLVDLDFDDIPEVVVVESDLRLGARLAVYDETGPVAATPFIGRAHRWLAPVGAADLDGDGAIELAYVDRPHLAKTLRVWRYADGGLTEVAALQGLTNHRIGEDFISGGVRDCGDGPEIVTADAGWSRIMATRLRDGDLSARVLGAYAPAALSAALGCR